MRRTVLWLGVVALSACGESDKATESVEEAVVDLDEDGFSADEDCDDADAMVHPDARELCDIDDQLEDEEIWISDAAKGWARKTT